MYWHICKSKSKLKSYFRTFVLFLYVRYYMSGLSSPSHGVAMATIHFSTKVASFYFSGLIMTKYQKGSCILDILPSMVNKGLKLGLSSVGKMYIVSAILRNGLTCLYGNTTSDFFQCNPPELETYFALVLQFRLTVLKMIVNNSSIMVLWCKLATQQWNQEHLHILRSFAGFNENCWKHVGVTASVLKGDKPQHTMYTSRFWLFLPH